MKRLFVFSLSTVPALALACQGVPDNVYAFFRDHLAFRVKVQRLKQADAVALSQKYAKYMGMALEESDGDTAKVARHGKERKRGNFSLVKDSTTLDEVTATLGEIRTNVDRFVPDADHQINFGMFQMSPDMAVYGGDGHIFVRQSLSHLQEMARDPSKHAMMLEHCGSEKLIRASRTEIIQELMKVSKCNPVLEAKLVTVGKGKKKKQSLVPTYNRERISCFAKLTMLCPGLGLQVIGRYPMSYWGTKNAKPVCATELKTAANALFGGGGSVRSSGKH